MLLNAPCVDGLKDRPTRSRGAKRPPTRSRVPWTRRTSPPWGRNPPSTSRILLAPPRTAGAWSSAPRGESGRTLRGGQARRKAALIKMHSSSTPAPFPFLPPGCFSRLRRRLDTRTDTHTSPVAPRSFPWSTSWPPSQARPHGPVPVRWPFMSGDGRTRRGVERALPVARRTLDQWILGPGAHCRHVPLIT